jgi:collagenase-like PrtC family protease
MTVAFNGDLELLPRLAATGAVESIYGKMTRDLVGGGRAAYLLADFAAAQLKEAIVEAHRHGLKFIYLLNAPSMANRELTREFNRELETFIGGLVELGVDGTVVAHPYLLQMIKARFPSLKVSVSTFAHVNSIRKARFWEDLGADRIVLVQEINRAFELLAKIRKAVSCELELFANAVCLHQCPLPQFHSTAKGFASSSRDENGGFFIDYCALHCARRRLEQPVEFVRSSFIRPEDVGLYEELGFDAFKLSDRYKSTSWLIRATEAYAARRHDGNLADLIAYPFHQSAGEKLLSNPAKWLARPEHVRSKALRLLRELGQGTDVVQIENRALDGFIEFFRRHDCTLLDCDVDCGHCAAYAKQAVRVNKQAAAEKLQLLEELLKLLTEGEGFERDSLLETVGVKIAALAAQ